jgi:hypothetical protein
MPQYTEYTFAGNYWRDGVRSENWVLDVALTPLGFDGIEDIDWTNRWTLPKTV